MKLRQDNSLSKGRSQEDVRGVNIDTDLALRYRVRSGINTQFNALFIDWTRCICLKTVFLSEKSYKELKIFCSQHFRQMIN